MKYFKEINGQDNSVTRYVMRWANAQVRGGGYDSVDGPLKDLLHGGCAAGTLGGLIYTSDIHKFFKAHCLDVLEIVHQYQNDLGEAIQCPEHLDPVTHQVWLAVEITAADLQATLDD